MATETWRSSGRVLAAVAVSLCLGMGLHLGACSSSPAADGGADASPEDASDDPSGPSEDARVPDASDSGRLPDGDASAARLEVETGTSAYLRIFDGIVFGNVYLDDTIVRVVNGPECVAFVRSAIKCSIGIGTMTIGGDMVGRDGGPPAPVAINPDETPCPPGPSYAHFLDAPPFFFRPTGNDRVLVDVAGLGGDVAALPVTTLRGTQFEQVTVTAPVPADAGALAISTAADFVVRWTVPDGGSTTQKVFIGMRGVALGNRTAELACSFDFNSGQAVLPQSLLAALKTQLGGTGKVDIAAFKVFAGDLRIVSARDTTYLIEVSRQESTTYTEGPATLE
jgi:hypothetical protein